MITIQNKNPKENQHNITPRKKHNRQTKNTTRQTNKICRSRRRRHRVILGAVSRPPEPHEESVDAGLIISSFVVEHKIHTQF